MPKNVEFTLEELNEFSTSLYKLLDADAVDESESVGALLEFIEELIFEEESQS